LTALCGYSSAASDHKPANGSSEGANCLLFVDSPTFRSQFGPFGDHNFDMPSLLQTDVGDGFIPKPPALGDLTRMALSAMLPKIKSDMSLINSVIELKDFTSLPKTLARLSSLATTLPNFLRVLDPRRKYVGSLPSKMKQLYRTFTEKTPTLRELSHGSADGYLQLEFNILPLLRDITAISGALYNAEASMRKLLSQAGRLQRRHFSFAWQEYESAILYVKTKTGVHLDLGQFAGSSTSAGRTGVYNAHYQVFDVTRRATHYVPTKFHAEVEFSYYFTQFQTEHARLLSLLDVLGVNLNPAIIWNAIPWSFLVDWVFSVSRVLGNYKTINMEPQVSIHRYLWSLTKHRRISCSFKQQGASATGNHWDATTLDTYLPTMYETTYRRDVQLPDSSNSLFGSGLSASELSLGVALANTQGRPPRTRVRF
jgi:hypothetical protein